MSNKTAEELAAEASAPGTFSFIERLRGRGYAKDDVVIYLNEDVGYKLQKLEDEYANVDRDANAARATRLEGEIEELKTVLGPDKITFYCQGISNKEYEAIEKLAEEAFPFEYDEYSNPFTGETSKRSIPSDERNEYFTDRLWAAHIKQIVDADGKVSTDAINHEFVHELREFTGLAALNRLGSLIEKLRLATDWIEHTEDEDFLVKP